MWTIFENVSVSRNPSDRGPGDTMIGPRATNGSWMRIIRIINKTTGERISDALTIQRYCTWYLVLVIIVALNLGRRSNPFNINSDMTRPYGLFIYLYMYYLQGQVWATCVYTLDNPSVVRLEHLENNDGDLRPDILTLGSAVAWHAPQVNRSHISCREMQCHCTLRLPKSQPAIRKPPSS